MCRRKLRRHRWGNVPESKSTDTGWAIAFSCNSSERIVRITNF